MDGNGRRWTAVGDWGPFILVVSVNTVTTLSTRAMRWWRTSRAPAVVLAGPALWADTGLLEIGQRWVPWGTSQWIDVVGNAIGISLGLTVGLMAFRFIAHRHNPAAVVPNVS